MKRRIIRRRRRSTIEVVEAGVLDWWGFWVQRIITIKRQPVRGGKWKFIKLSEVPVRRKRKLTPIARMDRLDYKVKIV